MKRSPNAGITLLETLVSLAVMAIIALMLAQGMGAMLRLSSRSSSGSEDVDEMAARLQLRRVVEWAADAPFPGFPVVGLHGDSHSVAVESWYPDSPFWAGAPVVVSVSVDQTGAVHAKSSGLDLQQKPFTLDQVISGSGALVVRYFGQRKGGSKREWHDEWSAEDGLPELLELASAEPTSGFPPTVIRPAKQRHKGEMSLSTLLPPALP
ncbi:PulJ/GspJ family protein [Stagnihabitans tardus]|uniref:Prepilin-type N-terminal cleavage/methylation domain-containing protein n=1 Tax=Stagnihabitans tardus TaxID=2699202 RepID=A0AAE4YET4_9RHOB|nr:prepilin-type N-terminal cleavage/methylation domain-containing protein [Stagnihabitans tardus]NBZ90071.1 hypothetical protein [Stagnihabitans tardus]